MQILVRSLPPPLFGTMAQVPVGPMMAKNDNQTTITALLTDALMRCIKTHHIQYLIMQVSNRDSQVITCLRDYDFRPSPIKSGLAATITIDLTPTSDDIFAGISKSTRKNIRRGEKRGLTVRLGTEADISTFYRLHQKTNQRHDFRILSQQYFTTMWQIFHPHGYVQLFVAEYQGEPVSVRWCMLFGDTFTTLYSGWSGAYSKHFPNEVMHWTMMQWAKTHGYRVYDLYGLDLDVARRLVQGHELTEEQMLSWSSFKTRFGGTAHIFPPAYEYIAMPPLRQISRSPLFWKALQRVKLRGTNVILR